MFRAFTPHLVVRVKVMRGGIRSSCIPPPSQPHQSTTLEYGYTSVRVQSKRKGRVRVGVSVRVRVSVSVSVSVNARVGARVRLGVG